MQFTNCMTRLPLFYNPYDLYELYENEDAINGSYQFRYIGESSGTVGGGHVILFEIAKKVKN